MGRERGAGDGNGKNPSVARMGQTGHKGTGAATWETGKDKTGNMIMVTCGRVARADKHGKGEMGSKKQKEEGSFRSRGYGGARRESIREPSRCNEER